MRPAVSIDLDHAAATPIHPAVMEAIAEAQRIAHANPSSQHALGRAAWRMLEDARERIVTLLGGSLGGSLGGALGGAMGGSAVAADRDRLVFTSGASEANHLAILGMAGASSSVGEIMYSRRDHAGSVHAARTAAGRGWRLHELPLDPRLGTAGAAIASGVEESRSEPASVAPRIISLTLVCGQTGSIEEMSQHVAEGTRDRGRRDLVHVDATQAVGLLPVSFRDLSVATMSLAPHKFGGPRGIGGLLIRGGVPVVPVQAGSQEFGLRGGTEAVPLAVGFARALEIAVADREEAARRVAALRDRLESGLLAAARSAGIPAVVIAAEGRRCPHISTIAFPGLDRQALAMAADLAGVCLATGTACASGSSEPAPALVAMGLAPDVVRGAVRLSVGRTTTPADVVEAVARLTPLFQKGASHQIWTT